MPGTRVMFLTLVAWAFSTACVPSSAPTGDAGADSAVGASDARSAEAGAQSAADSAGVVDATPVSSDVFLPVSRCTLTPMLERGSWVQNIPVVTASSLQGCDGSNNGHLFPIDPGNATEIRVQMIVRGFIPVVGVRSQIAMDCEAECDDEARPLRAVTNYETTLHLTSTGPQLLVVGSRGIPESGATFDLKFGL